MIKILLSIFIFMCTLSYPCALTVDNLYGDVGATTSYAENLLLYALNRDSDFLEKDYVIYRSQQYVYQIVWADELIYNGTSVTGNNVQIVSYERDDSMNYSYSYSTDSSYTLSNVNYLVTSNVPNLGIISSTYMTLEHEENQKNMMIMLTSCAIGLMIIRIRRE